MAEPEPSIRLDKWLWQARFFRTRAGAARAVSAGAVRLNAVRVAKPAAQLRVGDGLTFPQGAAIRVVRVVALGARRGPAAEARTLYEEVAAGRDAGPPAVPGAALEAGCQAVRNGTREV